jgi:hypothetical protein
MGSQRFIQGLLIAGAGWAVFQMPLPVHAAVFNFTSPPTGNASIKSFLDSGITLTASNSNSTGSDPANLNTLNNTGQGFCAWAKVGTTNGGLGRCGYGPTDPNGGVSSYQFAFDKPVSFNSFNVSNFESPEISSGTIGFSTDNVNFTDVLFNSTGNKAISFSALAGQPVFVRTSATFGPGSDTGIFRLGSLDVTEVPGPLPIMGVGAAFSMSRKMRRLSAKSQRLAGVN